MRYFFRMLLLMLYMQTGHVVVAQYYAFEIGGIYAQTTKPGQEVYLQTLKDVFQLDKAPNVSTGIGIDMGFIIHGENGEMEASIAYIGAGDIVSDTGANTLHFKSRDIAFYFGGNYLPLNWFLLGGGLHINAASNTTTLDGITAPFTSFESLPTTDVNIFRGYSVGFKLQAGFVLPFESDEWSALRILPYYNMNFGQYDFFNVTDARYLYYNGDKKTRLNSTGIQLQLVFGFE